jgi:hypothetical protein
VNERGRDFDERRRPEIVQRKPTIEVPRPLAASAFVVKNGERLWPVGEALELVDWLAQTGHAVLGGEVYQRHEIGWGTYSREWSTTPPRAPAEAWESFVERARSAAIEYLRRESVANEVPPPLYFLAFAAEDAPEVRKS